MGDRIAVFQPGGRLAQFDTPMAVLEQPTDDYVARFVGADRGLKRLSLSRVRDVRLDSPPTVKVGSGTREALRLLEESERSYLLLVDDQDHPVGWLSRRELQQAGPLPAERAWSPEPLVDKESTLRDALSAMLGSAVQEGLVVDEHGRLLGSLSIEALSSVLRQEATVGS
jgi:osmoprotectant transport system ATP-binding protein